MICCFKYFQISDKYSYKTRKPKNKNPEIGACSWTCPYSFYD